VYDITGAGDMVLAALGLCQAANLSLAASIRIANVAAGLEVERLGVAPVTREELSAALHKVTWSDGPLSTNEDQPVNLPRSARERNPSSEIRNPKSSSKLITLAQLLNFTAVHRATGKSIVFTNGCFDLLHAGHVACLTEAAALGDVLVVAVNSDASVRALKGEVRPIVGEHHRAAMLAALACVDHVLIFDDPTPHKLLEQIRPDLLVKGGTSGEIIGHEIVDSYGGRAVHIGEAPNVSTTNLIARIRNPAPCGNVKGEAGAIT
jgi:D-beta-D-heptose 7-phosphate kinase/D-beta-D-heptose 1-phosphate adenosyltransferase